MFKFKSELSLATKQEDDGGPWYLHQAHYEGGKEGLHAI